MRMLEGQVNTERVEKSTKWHYVRNLKAITFLTLSFLCVFFGF